METSVTDNYIITTDRSLMRVDDIHHWLSNYSYWAKGIPPGVVRQAFDHSFVAGVLLNGRQVGYARFVTDYAVFAYLADVYIEEAHRGRGLSKAMIRLMMDQPWIKDLRRLMLATVDAHGLYAGFGFTAVAKPERLMEIVQAVPASYQPPMISA